MNLKNIKNLKRGLRELTPVQLCQGRLAGYYGMVVGLVLATYSTFYRGSWGLGIFLLFLTWFQFVSLLAEQKTLIALKEMQLSLASHQGTIDQFNKKVEDAQKELEGKDE